MATKVFPTEMADRGTVLGADKLLIWNSTTGSSEEYTTVTKLTKIQDDAIVAVDNKISASQGNLLGGIAFDASAPTPAANGRYVFTSAGSCTWITGGAVTVAVNDEVLVTYTAPSTYVYTYLSVASSLIIKQTTGTSTTDVMSQKAVSSELNNKVDSELITTGKNLFNKDTLTPNAYINYGNGTVVTGQTSEYWCTDFIAVKAETLYSSITGMRDRAFYDSSKQFISGAEPYATQLTTPVGAAYIRYSQWTGDRNLTMFNEGSTAFEFEPYYNKFLYDQNLQSEIDSKLNADMVTTGANIFNKDTATLNAYIDYTNGSVASSADWWCSDYIPVKEETQYSGIQHIRDRAYYDADKVYISGAEPAVTTFTTPANAAYVRFSQYGTDINTAILNEGETPLSYQPYHNKFKYDIEQSIDVVEVILPDTINAIVGDTLQLFYRGIIKAWNPYNYDIVINCTKGAWYPRYFEYTPVVGDIGTTTLQIKVKDNNGNILGYKTCNLVTKAAVGSPASEIKALFIGDSLTAAGVYTQEAYRRLTGAGGTPAGKELTNISFDGRKPYGSIGAEGNSGWKWGDYLTGDMKANTFAITAPSVMPAVGSEYKDANDVVYTMWWDYSTTSIKMWIYDYYDRIGTTPPASGTLTKLSGTGDATITYSSFVESSGNPFWNDGTAALDFKAYVDKWMGGSVDVVYTLLTWNDQYGNRTDFSAHTNYAKTLFAHIHTNYPSAKIKLMGVQVSDLRGGVRVDGTPAENTYTDTYGLMVTALNMNTSYQALANEVGYVDYVEFVNVSTQVDSEYNMPYTEKTVNTRFSGSETEKIGTNDVHPNTDGYNQIADVVYRNFIANFCQ